MTNKAIYAAGDLLWDNIHKRLGLILTTSFIASYNTHQFYIEWYVHASDKEKTQRHIKIHYFYEQTMPKDRFRHIPVQTKR